ncbi:hypothetical protein [Alteribacillus sp. HJP-4]|uniref:hypothetical protein n=1 Tax=Alteribacillus sp. HJP-4 TaxID=2775394 RepID=UPI0035CD2529
MAENDTNSKREFTVGELAHIIDTEHNRIYAYPHKSEDERKESDRLMQDFIKKSKAKLKYAKR